MADPEQHVGQNHQSLTEEPSADASRRRVRLVIGSVSTLLGAAYVLGSQAYGLGVPAKPGPGLYPTIVGLLVIGIGLTLLVRTLQGYDLDEGEAGNPEGRVKLVWMSAAFVLYTAALFVVGFTISNILLTYVSLHVLESRMRLLGRVLYSVALVIICELLFAWFFGVSFPGGLISSLL